MVASARANARSVPGPTAKMSATARAKPTRVAKRAGSSEPGQATAEPFLRFYHSKALRAKTNAVLAALEATPDDETHRAALADLVAELTEAGMDYYYMRPMRLAKVGFVGEQSARLGVASAAALISSVSRKFIARMDRAQLLIVARHIRELA